MKSIYTKPEIAINSFNSEDIITASGGIVIDNGNFTLVEKKKAVGDNAIDF